MRHSQDPEPHEPRRCPCVAGLLRRASGSGLDASAIPAAVELAAAGSPARQHRAVLEAARVCLDGDARAWADFAAWLVGQPAPALQRVFDTFCACVRNHQARPRAACSAGCVKEQSFQSKQHHLRMFSAFPPSTPFVVVGMLLLVMTSCPVFMLRWHTCRLGAERIAARSRRRSRRWCWRCSSATRRRCRRLRARRTARSRARLRTAPDGASGGGQGAMLAAGPKAHGGCDDPYPRS